VRLKSSRGIEMGKKIILSVKGNEGWAVRSPKRRVLPYVQPKNQEKPLLVLALPDIIAHYQGHERVYQSNTHTDRALFKYHGDKGISLALVPKVRVLHSIDRKAHV
jgi:hypothetical protein